MLLLLFSFTGPVAYAGKAQKGFEAINRYDFFKARDIFLGLEKRQPAVANFGLARIFIFERNPYHDIDSALFRIERAEHYFYALSEKKRIKIERKLPIDSLEINKQKKLLGTLAFKNYTAEKNTVEGWADFINRFTFAEELDLARENLYQLAYDRAVQMASAKALNDFMEQYPDAPQTKAAIELFYEKQYKEETAEGTVSSFERFIKNHPYSPFLQEAELRLFELFTKSNTQTSFLTFARKYPNNPYSGKAWRKVAAMYLSEQYSPQKLVEFRLDYPDYPFLNELVAEIQISTEKFYPYELNGKFGFINAKGQVRVAPDYEWVGSFSDGLAQAGKNGKTGFINKFGNWVIEPIYDDAEPFFNSFSAVELNGYFGLIDRTGNQIIKPTFADVGKASEGFVAVANEQDLYGYFDYKGVLKILHKYSYASEFTPEKLAVVALNGRWGLINSEENVIIPFEFDWVDIPRGGFIRVRKQDKFGLFDLQGNLVLDASYMHIGLPQENRMLVIKGNKLGYFNIVSGRFAIPVEEESWPMANSTADFKNGVALSRSAGKFGFIDTVGTKVYARVFDAVGAFTPPLVAVSKRGKWGYANEQVKLAINYDFDTASDFVQGLAFVSKKGKFYFIDTAGKPLNKNIYASILRLEHPKNLYQVEEQDGSISVLDALGRPMEGLTNLQEVEFLDEILVLCKRNFRRAWYNFSQMQFVKIEDGF
ncbi:MAG: WG repeat-containing protein [Luteibaculaceae bacterium]